MKNNERYILIIFCFFLFICCQKSVNYAATSQIKLGMTEVSGKIVNLELQDGFEKFKINLFYPNPVTGELAHLEVNLDENGNFYFEVPLECDSLFGFLNSELWKTNSLLIKLVNGKKSSMKIIVDKNGDIEIKIDDSLEITSYDAVNWKKIYFQMHQYVPLDDRKSKQQIYELDPKEYVKFSIQNMAFRMSKIEKHTTLSPNIELFVLNSFKMFFLRNVLLDYKNSIDSYRTDRLSDKQKNFVVQEPKLSYYEFLQDFALNNSQYLLVPDYFEVLQVILSNKTLNISAIDDIPIDVWIKQVKSIMSGLTGLDSGLFYELLIAGAYMKQFRDDIRPLTEKQKENLQNYNFENKDIKYILLRKNEQIIINEKNKRFVNINQTPDVSKEKLMDVIISKYKGKTVVVDFWATWCLPCLSNMKELIEIKNGISEKDVAFIYITGESSPKYLWKEKIENIGGEHYYLTQDEWYYIMDKFEFKGIPAYLFYDQNGVLKYKKMGIIGDVEMKKRIENILP